MVGDGYAVDVQVQAELAVAAHQCELHRRRAVAQWDSCASSVMEGSRHETLVYNRAPADKKNFKHGTTEHEDYFYYPEGLVY